jgi:hypothetical protein
MFYLDVAYSLHICCKCMFQMFHLLRTYVAFKCFHVARVSCCSESQEHGGVMVARHGHRGMVRDELGVEVAHGASVSCGQGVLSVGSRGTTAAVHGGANDLESRWAGWVLRAGQVV